MSVSAVFEPFGSLLADVCWEDSGSSREQVRDIVTRHRGRVVTLTVTELDIMSLLEDPTEEVEHRVTIGPFEDTCYRRNPEILEEWQELYLPESTPMEVIGVIKEFHGGELVLMVCGDGRVFAYKQETLHLASFSLKELSEFGFQFPSDEQYYCGKRYDCMTEAERKEEQIPERMAKILKRDQEIVKRMTESFMAALNMRKKEKAKEPSGKHAANQSSEESRQTKTRKRQNVNSPTGAAITKKGTQCMLATSHKHRGLQQGRQSLCLSTVKSLSYLPLCPVPAVPAQHRGYHLRSATNPQSIAREGSLSTRLRVK